MKDLNSYKITKYDLKNEIYDLKNEISDLNNKIADLNMQISTLNNEKVAYQNDINSILNSKSWKVTKPLRMISGKLSKKQSESEPLATEEELTIKKLSPDKNFYKNFKPYNSTYQDNIDFSANSTDIKTIAFYLPQYHTFKENDEWWGKGFMEWTNTKKSLPRFDNHYQPRTPHKDIGYYTLDNIETIKKQVELAKQHGIYGFCYYYYWFSGKRLMEKPGDLFLKSSIDFPFCLCWANENWTRAWDGLNKDILIKQEYAKSDYKQFIKDIKKYVTDKRYIKIDGKPVIMIYNPTAIPNFSELVENWRKYAREEGIGEIYIMSKCDLFNQEHKYTEYVDAEFDFPPQGVGHAATKITGLPSSKIFNYEQIVNDIEHLYREHFPLKSFYYTVTMGWDNSARRKEEFTVYYNYSLKSYYKWLRIIIEETRRRNPLDKRFMFVNAWNEWAEGTYLEPDEKYGYANINTLSKAIYDLPISYKENSNKKKKGN